MTYSHAINFIRGPLGFVYFSNIREKSSNEKLQRQMTLCKKKKSCIFPYNQNLVGLNQYAPIEVYICVGGGLFINFLIKGLKVENLRYETDFSHFPLCLKSLNCGFFKSYKQDSREDFA